MTRKIKVTVWNEYRHEKHAEEVKKVYPEGIHSVISDFLNKEDNIIAKTATLDEPEHGLTDEVLNNTDVLIWWAHGAHNEVKDEIVEKVYKKILYGMGFIALHSAHACKIFKKLCGTNSLKLKWRVNAEKERIWVIEPGHPIAEGLDEYFEIEKVETYGERFEIPAPDDLVFISWFEGGNVFRSGVCYNRGKGNIFYFKPGHESYPVYYQKEVQKVIKNAVNWAVPVDGPDCKHGYSEPLE